jgi:hypothetical protein
MNWGDVPAWVALVVALCAAALSLRSLHWEKQSAEAAEKSANEAARANLIAERALELRGATNQQSEPADDPTHRVVWHIEGGDGAQYVLRNVGRDVAEHVYVDRARAPGINRNLPDDSVIRPSAGHTMLIKGSMQHPMPTELYLRWAGQDEWVAVPLPG